MNIKQTDCILWTGATNSGGYPVTWYNNKIAYAHRVAAKAKHGDIVRHSCDNPKCVNPAHLLLGTSADNSLDMVIKNRQAKGEQCGNAKLTTTEVLHIRALKPAKLSSRKVASIFNISKTNVLDIWHGRIWRHI